MPFGGDVGPTEANEQHKFTIGLTRDRLTVVLEAGSAPVVPSEGTTAVCPLRPQFRRARWQCVVAGASGGCASVWGRARGGWPTPAACGRWSSTVAQEWRVTANTERRRQESAREGGLAALNRRRAERAWRGGLALKKGGERGGLDRGR
jgi:hypothetical protein